MTRYWPATIGRPVHGIVVDDDDVAIAGEVHIQLDVAHAHLESQIESR
jgi:hypothetical protein